MKEIVYVSSSKSKALTFVGLLFFTLICGFLVIVEAGLEDRKTMILSLAFFGFGSIIFLIAMLFKLPRLKINKEGIHYTYAYGWKKTWKWKHVGRFKAGSMTLPRTTKEVYFACAFTDTNHDLFEAHHQAEYPTIFNADIRLSLDGFLENNNLKEAKRFAKMLNEWRETYGAPENNIDVGQTKGLVEAIKQRKQIEIAAGFLFLMIFSVVMHAIFD